MEEEYTFEEIKKKLYTDSLTKVLSRAYIDERFENTVKDAVKKNRNINLALIDIDEFKLINDTLGHMAGDEILKGLSVLLRKFLVSDREVYLARYGGDEFVLMSVGESYEKFCKRIEDCIHRINAHKFELRGRIVKTSISVGCSNIDETEDKSFSSCLDMADKRLYKAKKEGKNRLLK